MSATIAEQECTFLHGVAAPDLDVVLQTWHVPGTDGEGVQHLGRRGSPFHLVAVLYDTAAAVDQWILGIKQAEGTMVDFEDDWGDVDTVLLKSVRKIDKKPITHPTEQWECRGEMVLELVKTES